MCTCWLLSRPVGLFCYKAGASQFDGRPPQDLNVPSLAIQTCMCMYVCGLTNGQGPNAGGGSARIGFTLLDVGVFEGTGRCVVVCTYIRRGALRSVGGRESNARECYMCFMMFHIASSSTHSKLRSHEGGRPCWCCCCCSAWRVA